AVAWAGRHLASGLPPDPTAGDARCRIGERGAPRPVPDGTSAEGPRARPGELLRGPRRAGAAAGGCGARLRRPRTAGRGAEPRGAREDRPPPPAPPPR